MNTNKNEFNFVTNLRYVGEVSEPYEVKDSKGNDKKGETVYYQLSDSIGQILKIKKADCPETVVLVPETDYTFYLKMFDEWNNFAKKYKHKFIINRVSEI